MVHKRRGTHHYLWYRYKTIPITIPDIIPIAISITINISHAFSRNGCHSGAIGAYAINKPQIIVIATRAMIQFIAVSILRFLPCNTRNHS